MNNAALYQRSNGQQRRDAELLINEFANIFRWRSDGCDSILDIGCGSGDVTMDFLLPILPKNFSRLTGFDLSTKMVEYARKKYANSRISFEQFNIGIDLEKQSISDIEPFDHITSFYCLHWLQNQQKVAQNLYKLCKPNGDILIVFLTQHPYFDIYEQLAASERWAQHMTDVARFMPPFRKSDDAAEELSSILGEAGFRDYQVELREYKYIFHGINTLKRESCALSPAIFIEFRRRFVLAKV